MPCKQPRLVTLMKNNKQLTIKTLLLSALISLSTQAEELTIALGNFEPLFSHPNQPSLFKDLIDGIYQYLPQTQVNYQYMLSNARLLVALNEQKVDGATNIFSADDIKGCITGPVFAYSDVAVSLKNKNYTIDSMDDLKTMSVVSYQGASTLLGEHYRKAVLSNQYYQEIANPPEQARLLSAGLVDVSIGDKYIFLYSLKKQQGNDLEAKNYRFHYIFPPIYSAMGFNKQRHCDDFNQALAKFKASGQYQVVYQKHLKSLGYNNGTQPQKE